MRSEEDVRQVFGLARTGLSLAEIVQLTNCPRTTVRRWLQLGEAAVQSSSRQRVAEHYANGRCTLRDDVDGDAYAYLLGQYLGDGHIVAARRVFRLEIACCEAYPGILEECAEAIGRVLPANRVGRRQRAGVIAVGCYSKHLPCLFPQHGHGRKHEREIALEPWQEGLVLDQSPDLFLRGLIHSDGWRGTNRVRGANGSPYEYPRYQFSNRSFDIRDLFGRACDRLGVEWRPMTEYTISVAKRASVALLDEFVGPKR